MSFTKRLCEGIQKKEIKIISWIYQWCDTLHHKGILFSEPGCNRRECIYSCDSPFDGIGIEL